MTTEEQNIQAAQGAYAAFGRGDIASIVAMIDEKIEWNTPVTSVPGSGIKKGHAGVVEFFGAVNDTWQFEAFEPREFIAKGDRLVVIGYYRAKSRKTGRLAESDWVMTWRFNNGKVTHFQEFTDTAGLEAAIATSAAGAK